MTGAVVLERDAVTALREESAAGRRYDLVLLDPPYDAWSQLAGRLGELVPRVLEESGIVVVESDARVEPELPLDRVTTRRYGSARLTLFTR